MVSWPKKYFIQQWRASHGIVYTQTIMSSGLQRIVKRIKDLVHELSRNLHAGACECPYA